jgi:hypothetical protein
MANADRARVVTVCPVGWHCSGWAGPSKHLSIIQRFFNYSMVQAWKIQNTSFLK